MGQKLQNRVAIITGSTRGIGKAIARAYLDEGASVVITSSRQENVDAAVADLGSRNVHGMVCDVTDYASVEWLVRAAVDRFGSLDIFINNAGISDPFYSVTDSDPVEWGRVIDTNLKGTYHGSRAAMSWFLEHNPRGKIINMAGSGTDKGSNTPFISAYGSTKAAIARFTYAMAAEYRQTPASIMLLHPGLVRTEIISTEKPTPEMQRQQNTFATIVDIFAQPPSVAARLAVRMGSAWSDGKTGIYLSALNGWRKKMLLFSYPLRKLFNAIDRTNY
ncbi:SDR family NAD(P)-dependent oxidoreductase [Prosthecochloris sp. N3]|uniref:SDR family NAD(P)-dependent oxidoreductase n=1 Tax=Prosthecochloris ethylica TaxID=2743976 RepID=A0ABR9XV17_9CHLB|nr:SDR family NAD(P)-dependent oxidoreductase [Prosthecochloris sp. ZM_2]MBF0587430.1 SDR family NAD(P)-dependent oxidoreductase [Prosthecochloris ethylica]MBF0637615.1 SDR family NAD(P)-dependent oxidoreductase [Prosthecochloris ethylica]NUK48510.1 SDR family NAD(P)-dependent oxidoreductase [Prosthecochloris ethylica]RNA68269.1 SDR family NAD(P)-dependent oxidoreductase [Prosthecochloris sp. ZM_2]